MSYTREKHTSVSPIIAKIATTYNLIQLLNFLELADLPNTIAIHAYVCNLPEFKR